MREDEELVRVTERIGYFIQRRLTRVVSILMIVVMAMFGAYCRLLVTEDLTASTTLILLYSLVVWAFLGLFHGLLYAIYRRPFHFGRVLFLGLMASGGMVAGFRIFEWTTSSLFVIPFCYVPLFVFMGFLLFRERFL